jgi:hypothetical protein
VLTVFTNAANDTYLVHLGALECLRWWRSRQRRRFGRLGPSQQHFSPSTSRGIARIVVKQAAPRNSFDCQSGNSKGRMPCTGRLE